MRPMRPMRTIYRDIVGAFIFSKDEYLLLGKNIRGTYEGMWTIPGGKIDKSETLEQALIREVLEETGIDISKEKITRIEGTLEGESLKILKESGERVLGKYVFYNFIIYMKSNHNDISLESRDDFADATWHSARNLKNIPLPPPSIVTLTKLGYL